MGETLKTWGERANSTQTMAQRGINFCFCFFLISLTMKYHYPGPAVLSNTIYLFCFVFDLFHPVPLFALETKLWFFLWRVLSFIPANKLVGDGLDSVEEWFQALSRPVHFSFALSPETWFSLSHGPLGSMESLQYFPMESLKCFLNIIKLVGIKFQTLSPQHPDSC